MKPVIVTASYMYYRLKCQELNVSPYEAVMADNCDKVRGLLIHKKDVHICLDAHLIKDYKRLLVEIDVRLHQES